MTLTLQQCVDTLHAHGGNKTAAAKSLGITRSNLWHKLARAKKKGLLKEPVDSGKQDKARIKELERTVAMQQERIEKLNASKYRLPPAGKQPRDKDAYCRVVIPDTHGSVVNQQALAAFLYDFEQLAPAVREVVMLGDHLECGGFLAQHHTLGYVAQTEYTFEDDVDATNKLLDRLQAICPHADYHYLEGNHERRIEQFCVTQAVKNNADAAFLRSLFSVESVLHLKTRGIKLYEQGKFYDGLRIPATIKLGSCYFTHGSRVGRNPARAMLGDFGGNVVFGHVHAIDSATSRNVQTGEIGAWCCGCLCELQPLWRHTQITGWSHGYGLQFVRPSGDFLHINVPIIDGKSYLVQLTNRLAG